MVGSAHAIPSAPLYNIEFGGFTKLLTRETKCPLPAGTYTVKFVVQDVADRYVDAGLFIAGSSLKLYPFLRGDVNLDGAVNNLDFNIVLNNFYMCGKSYAEGDLTGDGCVYPDDFNEVLNNFNATGGNRDLKFDFDRDNDVDGADLLTWQRGLGLASCASRFEGDADDDGDVDEDDDPTQSSTALAAPCCCGGGQSFAAGGDGDSADGEEFYSASADLDHDGDVDYDDVVLFGKSIAEE